MTDTYFTVSDTPNDEYGRREVELHDGRKLSGRAYVRTSWKPAEQHHLADDKHVVMVELGTHLDDENGRTVYRRPDPNADEVSTGPMDPDHSAIIARPVRVNGIAYSGTLYVERDHNRDGTTGVWHVRDGYINRADDYFGKVTDAARSRLHDLAEDVAAEVATSEQLGQDKIRRAKRDVDDAERKVAKAEAELEAARKAAAEAINTYERRQAEA